MHPPLISILIPTYNQAGFNKGGLNKVNPVPSVPATPAKQNPNPVDKTSKKSQTQLRLILFGRKEKRLK